MPRGPSQPKKPKRDPRLRPLHAPVDPWAWVIDEPVRHVEAQPIEHNVHGLETKPSFYEMVKAALLADKMQYLRGVGMNSIYKHVAANWPVDLATYRRLTRVAVKRAVEAGKLETVNQVGTTYRLAPEERPNHGESKPAKSLASKSSRSGVKVSGKITRTNAESTKASKKRKAESDDEEDVPQKASKKKASQTSARGGRKDFDERQAGEGKWIWQYQDGGWHDYDHAASDEVESTYQLYEKEKATGRVIDVRSVASGSWEYQVDFRQYTQTNVKHPAHTVRSIRRQWRKMQ